MNTSSALNDLADRIASSKSVAVLTGAGISAESGIATFRDADGLWQKFKPEELANVRAFLDNPELVQGWYRYRREIAEEAAPNDGHLALARLESLIDSFTLITQNVDNLHQRAGSKNVVELHGNISRNYCIDCNTPADPPSSDEEIARCTRCGGLIRPDIVWFGEMLPPDQYERAELAARTADVFLSIGTSAAVYPAAGLPMLALDEGSHVVEINLQPSEISNFVSASINGRAGEILPRLVDAVEARIEHRS